VSNSSRSLRKQTTAIGYCAWKRSAKRRAAERAAGACGVHDLVQRPFDPGLVGFAHLVEHVPDLVRPAAREKDEAASLLRLYLRIAEHHAP
jgi:hypothetical protein